MKCSPPFRLHRHPCCPLLICCDIQNVSSSFHQFARATMQLTRSKDQMEILEFFFCFGQKVQVDKSELGSMIRNFQSRKKSCSLREPRELSGHWFCTERGGSWGVRDCGTKKELHGTLRWGTEILTYIFWLIFFEKKCAKTRFLG